MNCLSPLEGDEGQMTGNLRMQGDVAGFLLVFSQVTNFLTCGRAWKSMALHSSLLRQKKSSLYKVDIHTSPSDRFCGVTSVVILFEEQEESAFLTVYKRFSVYFFFNLPFLPSLLSKRPKERDRQLSLTQGCSVDPIFE